MLAIDARVLRRAHRGSRCSPVISTTARPGTSVRPAAIARAMVTEYGMSDRVGFQHFGEEDRDPWSRGDQHSDETAQMIDEEVKRIIDETYAQAKKTIDDNRDQVVAIAEALLKHETLTADEVGKLMRGESLGKTTVSDLLKAEREKNAAAEEPRHTEVKEKSDDGEADTARASCPAPRNHATPTTPKPPLRDRQPPPIRFTMHPRISREPTHGPEQRRPRRGPV